MMILRQGTDEACLYCVDVRNGVISSATWTAEPTGPTIGTPTNTSTRTTVLVSYPSVAANTRTTLRCLISLVGGAVLRMQSVRIHWVTK